uniref:BPI2 domain-containing protein n=1 Tax=Steinernema glaseri TaxID=37863 RepID=A0A1I8A4U6_9BILA
MIIRCDGRLDVDIHSQGGVKKAPFYVSCSGVKVTLLMSTNTSVSVELRSRLNFLIDSEVGPLFQSTLVHPMPSITGVLDHCHFVSKPNPISLMVRSSSLLGPPLLVARENLISFANPYSLVL